MKKSRTASRENVLELHPLFSRAVSASQKPLSLIDLGLAKLSGKNSLFEAFIGEYPHLRGIDLVEAMLEHFQFSFQASWKEKERIPPEGRVVIISNHPLDTLDALGLFKLVSEIRSDVKLIVESDNHLPAVVANSPLASIVLPFQMDSEYLPDIEQSPNKPAYEHLIKEGALIFFPCRDISRFRPKGVRDPKWRGDFLRLALAAQAPVLPVFIDASNSALFYSLSAIYKPLSSLLFVPETNKQKQKSLSVRIGESIAHSTFSQSDLPLKTQVKLFMKHVYKIGKGKPGVWPTQSAVAHPEPRKLLKQQIASQTPLGVTGDGKQIYLYQNAGSSSVLREIGRLREIAFRAVGEGTGLRRDVDHYDSFYNQLVLWDDEDLEIVGAYRLANAGEIIRTEGVAGLYSATLFEYSDQAHPLLEQGIELGRSFVQPKYWGKRSLDYLWYGIGAFLSRHREVRYLFGPVSLSNDLPGTAKDLLVYFFSLYFGQPEHHRAFLNNAGRAPQGDGLGKPPRQETGAEKGQAHAKLVDGVRMAECGIKLARAKQPYRVSTEITDQLKANFTGDDYNEDFKTLKHILSNMGCSIPPLYKQYSELCEPGGLVFLDFGVDPGFGHCIDGLVIVDITKVKDKKRERYIPSPDKAEEAAEVPNPKRFSLVKSVKKDTPTQDEA